MKNRKKVVVLGCNFAGLTVSRYIHKEAKENGKYIDTKKIHYEKNKPQ